MNLSNGVVYVKNFPNIISINPDHPIGLYGSLVYRRPIFHLLNVFVVYHIYLVSADFLNLPKFLKIQKRKKEKEKLIQQRKLTLKNHLIHFN